ncbi:MAG: insulinase family protein [Rhodobacteraceae bacterium]|nr:insulinase family protein [Paracoccaceae bacterium]
MILRVLTLCVVSLFLPFMARAELVAASSDPKIAQLTPMRNGLSAVTFVWAIPDFAMNRVLALNAGLSTAISAGTAELSPFEAETYREVNGISLGISTQDSDILLTMTAPHAVFAEALAHLNALLVNPAFSRDWYKRQSLLLTPVKATKNRRPDHVINVLSDYVRFPVETDGFDTRGVEFAFGMPRQIIIRTTERDPSPLIQSAVNGLTLRNADVEPTNKPDRPVDLPEGIIFAPDPDGEETLILAVHHSIFENAEQQINANLLLDYMGAYQGSEMFRIIRQEMRAAYDPASDFHQIARNQALLALSATVSTPDWPAVLETIRTIYESARAGDVGAQGLANNQRRLRSGFEYRFATNPSWTAMQFLFEYPDGTTGDVKIPLFSALVQAKLETIAANGKESLPPFSDYLILLIGGTLPPDTKMQEQNGYCELPLSEPLRYCLEKLQD